MKFRGKGLAVKLLTIITVVVGAFILGTLIFWGLGNLIIWAFKINFKWTILHSVCAELVYCLIKGMLDKE